MTKSSSARTQCMTCGTKFRHGHPCPTCNNSHVKRRRKAKRWPGDMASRIEP